MISRFRSEDASVETHRDPADRGRLPRLGDAMRKRCRARQVDANDSAGETPEPNGETLAPDWAVDPVPRISCPRAASPSS